ncbi:MAG: restriction endonuclease subunit S [Deltaproteobacteria bacterium]|nr:restriction endonuclease subunit S [Deltaproteobacteria bacterium]
MKRIKEFRIKNAANKRELNSIYKYYKEGEERLNLKEAAFKIPKTWKHCEINNIGNVCNGSTPSRKILDYWGNDISWVSSGEVQNCIIKKTSEKISQLGFQNSSVKLLPKGTVLIAMIGEGKTRGQAAVLDIDAACNQNVAGIIINHNYVLSKYLFFWLLLQYDRNRNVGSGSGPKALNCQKVRGLDFILPPLEEQKEIVRQVNKLFAFADKLETRYQKAKEKIDKLPQSVLAKTFRGELVPQDPNDEPASELLKKIIAEKEKLQAGIKQTRKRKVKSKALKNRS